MNVNHLTTVIQLCDDFIGEIEMIRAADHTSIPLETMRTQFQSLTTALRDSALTVDEKTRQVDVVTRGSLKFLRDFITEDRHPLIDKLMAIQAANSKNK